MKFKKRESGFYTINLGERLFWIQSPQRTESKFWITTEITFGLGFFPAPQTHHNTLAEAKADFIATHINS